MKKLLLLTALAAAALAPAQAQYTLSDVDAVSSLKDGGTYIIYDNFLNVTEAGTDDRRAFRFVDTQNGVVGGFHASNPYFDEFPASYVWVAEADGSSWKFKNQATGTYMPVMDHDAGSFALSENAGSFNLVAGSNPSKFRVQSTAANSIYWDGNAGSYLMAYWTNSGHEYSFYTVEDFAPVVEENTYYYLKAISPKGTANPVEGYLDVSGASESVNPVVSDTPSSFMFKPHPSESAPNKWLIGTDWEFNPVITASSWNVNLGFNECYWSFASAPGEFDTENPVVCLLQYSAGYKGFLGAEADKVIYDNLTASRVANGYGYWEVIRVPNQIEVTINIKNGSDDASPLVINTKAISGQTFPSGNNYVTCDNNQPVSASNTTATYTINVEGTPMRIYNERTDKYVYVNNDGLYQISGYSDPSTVFTMAPVGDDGGFILYNPAAHQFVGNIVATNKPTAVVSFKHEPQVFYTGKYDGATVSGKYYPVYADWIGTVTASAENDDQYKFFNDFSGNFVCGYERIDDGSKWIIVTNQANFEENWQLRQDLLDSRDAYVDALKRLGEEDTEGLYEFANSFKFNNDVNLDVKPEDKGKLQAMIDKVNEALEKWPAKVMESTKLYVIKSSVGRGALIYDPENDCMSTTGADGDADTTNNNHLWGFVKVGDKFYMYNRGAEKFASAYIYREGDGNATYAWTVSDIPTAITLTNEAYGKQEALANNLFTIEGGKSYNSNPAGMMIINGNKTKIPCALGEGNIADGTGFNIIAVRETTNDENMKDKVAEGFGKVNAKIDKMSVFMDGDYEASTHGKQVGHFTADAVSTLGTEMADAKALDDKEAAMYAALEARAKFDKTNRIAVVDQNVYHISDTEGNVHYTDGLSHLKEGFTEEMDQKLQNWLATVKEDGTVSFSHSHESGAEVVPAMLYDTAAINFMAGDASEFAVNQTKKPGVVTLGSDPTEYVITHVSADAKDAETTGIESIEASSSKAGAIYDLQGRKVSKASKGLYIINGVKTIVK